MKKYSLLIASLAALCSMTACTGQTTSDSNSNKTSVIDAFNSKAPEDSIAPQEEKASTISFAFVGDVMMGTNFPSEEYVTKDRGKTLFDDCKDVLRAADLTIANLEGTCYDGFDGETRKKTNSKTYYIFRMPGDHAQHLTDAGIDIVNFANNHSNDFGIVGRRNTLKKMEEVGIKATGIRNLAEGCVVERNGVKIAYVSFAASCTDVLDLNNAQEVERMVRKYRKEADLLVVGFHGGAEGVAYMHVPKKVEYYLGECRGDVMSFAHRCIDNGADIVVGHGPHVPRALELYNGHLIAYSLGNFCAPYRLGTNGATGHAPLLQVELNTADGTFSKGHIHSYIQVRGVGPRNDQNNGALNDIRRLTMEDFPATPLEITTDGDIRRK